MQPKKLSKIQTGPRLIQCPVCKRMTARVESKLSSAGTTNRRAVCHSPTCRSERKI